MAEGRPDTPLMIGAAPKYLWTNLFRCFAVALDPRKLFAAALGILVMSFGWYVLSKIFYYAAPTNSDSTYSIEATKRIVGVKKANGIDDYTEDDYKAKSAERLETDKKRWAVLNDLAGPGGKLSTLPWYEFRGENPYLFASHLSNQPAATWASAAIDYLLRQIPVLTEPLQKLLIPVIKMIDPNASFTTRLYLLLCLVWSITVWAFFGGIITRLAAVQFGNRERTTLKQATRFVLSRYVSYVLSPIVPLAAIAVIVLVMFLYGLVALIPIVGDLILYGLLFPLIIIGGIAMAVILIGLASYPLMYTTISTEGSDTFDAVSRSYNYVFQAPWSFIWYSFLSLLYGAAVTFLVILVGCLMMVMGKWAVSSAAGVTTIESRRPTYLFVYAPESLGWKELLLKGSDVAQKRNPDNTYEPENNERADAYYKDMTWANHTAAAIASFWMVFVFLLMIGFSYSYFWSASTMIYLLMRKKVDEVEIDEVYIEDLVAAPIATTPPSTPTPSVTTKATEPSVIPLNLPSPPVVPPPVTVPPVPPVVPVPPTVAVVPAPPAIPPADTPPEYPKGE